MKPEDFGTNVYTNTKKGTLLENIEDIKTMLQKGYTQKEIARKYARTKSAVSWALQKYAKEWWKLEKYNRPTKYGRCIECKVPVSSSEEKFLKKHNLKIPYCSKHVPKEDRDRIEQNKLAPRITLTCKFCGKTVTRRQKNVERLRELGAYSTAGPDNTYICRQCLSGNLFRETVLPKILAAREIVRKNKIKVEKITLSCVNCGKTIESDTYHQTKYNMWSNCFRKTRVCFRCASKVVATCQESSPIPDGKIIRKGYYTAVKYTCGCLETRGVPEYAKCPVHNTEIWKVYEKIGDIPEDEKSLQAQTYGVQHKIFGDKW